MSNTLSYEHLKSFSSTEGYWSTSDCVDVAKDILEYTSATKMLEIGFNIGYSASTWLQHGIESLIVLDIGYHLDTLPAIKATAKHFSDKQVKWWIGDSTSKDAFELEIPEIDIAFIDGEHSYKAAFSDSKLAIQNKAKWLVFDDVIQGHQNGIDKAIQKLIDDKLVEQVKSYKMTWTEEGEVILCKVLV